MLGVTVVWAVSTTLGKSESASVFLPNREERYEQLRRPKRLSRSDNAEEILDERLVKALWWITLFYYIHNRNNELIEDGVSFRRSERITCEREDHRQNSALTSGGR